MKTLYLTRKINLSTDNLKKINRDDIIKLQENTMSATLNIYQDKMNYRPSSDLDMVYATKLYTGTKFVVTTDYEVMIISGTLSKYDLQYITTKLLTTSLKLAVQRTGGKYVFNINNGDITLLYAIDDNGNTQTAIDLVDFVSGLGGFNLASTHRIIIHDLFVKCVNEFHAGYIISDDNGFIAKVVLGDIQQLRPQSASAFEQQQQQQQLEQVERNRIIGEITQEIGFTNISLATPEEVDELVEYYKRGKTHKNGSVSYDIRFMRIAREFATWSKDPSTQLGAVAVDEDSKIVLSQGYNGFPRGIKDDYRLYIRKLKYDHTVHAEMNVIYNASENGIPLKGSTLYVYGLPTCSDCATAIVQVKFKRVVICNTKDDGRWDESCRVARAKFEEAGIIVDYINKEDLD